MRNKSNSNFCVADNVHLYPEIYTVLHRMKGTLPPLKVTVGYAEGSHFYSSPVCTLYTVQYINILNGGGINKKVRESVVYNL